MERSTFALLCGWSLSFIIRKFLNIYNSTFKGEVQYCLRLSLRQSAIGTYCLGWTYYDGVFQMHSIIFDFRTFWTAQGGGLNPLNRSATGYKFMKWNHNGKVFVLKESCIAITQIVKTWRTKYVVKYNIGNYSHVVHYCIIGTHYFGLITATWRKALSRRKTWSLTVTISYRVE